MARYNHFSNVRYEQICFDEVAIGEKFRIDKHKNGRRRKDIICVKSGDLSYYEFKSKKEYTLHHSAFDVSHFSKPLVPLINLKEKDMYKILIDKTGTPKLVEVPNRNEFQSDVYGGFTQEAYEQALSTALADESKYIPIKNGHDCFNIKDRNGNYLIQGIHDFSHHIGQTFDLPENIGVSFQNIDTKTGEEVSLCIYDHHKKFAILKTLPPNSEDKGVQQSAPLATDNTLPPEQDLSLEIMAVRWVNEGTSGYPDPDDKSGVWMFNQLKEAFIAGATYAQHSSSQREQARNEAIQECIETLKEAWAIEDFTEAEKIVYIKCLLF